MTYTTKQRVFVRQHQVRGFGIDVRVTKVFRINESYMGIEPTEKYTLLGSYQNGWCPQRGHLKQGAPDLSEYRVVPEPEPKLLWRDEGSRIEPQFSLN